MHWKNLLDQVSIWSIILLLSTCGSQPEEPIELSSGEVVYPYHQANVGSIAFLNEWVSLKDLTRVDNQRQIVLTEGATFYAILLPEYSQTYYLHQLAPELSANELCKIGNWNVRFYLDEELIYEDDINPGAGGCFYRNEYAAVAVPFVANDEGDSNHWGAYLWKRFFYKERHERHFETGPQSLKLEFRPYLTLDGETKYGEVVAEGTVEISLETKAIAEADKRVQVIAPTDEWPLAVQNFDTTHVRTINEKIAQGRYQNVTSLVVIKDGELLVEEYFNGASRESLHDTRSVGKSFVGTLMGLAIADGHIKDELVTLGQCYSLQSFGNYSTAKEEITLKDLLIMQAPLLGNDADLDSPGNEENMYPTDDWVKFGLDLPIDEEKLANPRWEYFTAGSVLLGDILDKAVPNNLEQYADKRLLQPLGIDTYRWQYTPSGVVNTAGSFQLRSLDYAKYGWLYQQEGVWKGEQLLPASWVEASMTAQVQRGEDSLKTYGYQLWREVITYNEKPYTISYAAGNGGNMIVIFHDEPIAIVITATAYGNPIGHAQAWEMLERYLMPMLVSED